MRFFKNFFKQCDRIGYTFISNTVELKIIKYKKSIFWPFTLSKFSNILKLDCLPNAKKLHPIIIIRFRDLVILNLLLFIKLQECTYLGRLLRWCCDIVLGEVHVPSQQRTLVKFPHRHVFTKFRLHLAGTLNKINYDSRRI